MYEMHWQRAKFGWNKPSWIHIGSEDFIVGKRLEDRLQGSILQYIDTHRDKQVALIAEVFTAKVEASS